jgi:hypothetical protein
MHKLLFYELLIFRGICDGQGTLVAFLDLNLNTRHEGRVYYKVDMLCLLQLDWELVHKWKEDNLLIVYSQCKQFNAFVAIAYCYLEKLVCR